MMLKKSSVGHAYWVLEGRKCVKEPKETAMTRCPGLSMGVELP